MNSILKNKSKIIEDENKYIIKKSNKDIKELFEYLNTRSFNNIPEIVDETEEGIKYKYVDGTNDGSDDLVMASLLSDLHYKTAYYKDVSKNKYREIYEKISDKIEHIDAYYKEIIENIEMEIYPSPTHYLIERNFKIINGAINYSKTELKKWFKIVEKKSKERVVVVHNNPKLEHVIKGDKNYLVNWDNYVVDTPILDLYRLYREVNVHNNFKEIYDEYSKNFTLSEEEKKLFFILISIPPKIEEIEPELLNTKNIKNTINYFYRTNELIASINSNEKVSN